MMVAQTVRCVKYLIATKVLPYVSLTHDRQDGGKRARCPPYAGRHRGASEARFELVEFAFEVAPADGEG